MNASPTPNEDWTELHSYLNSVSSNRFGLQVLTNSSVSDSVLILLRSQCSTPCQRPIPPAEKRQAMSMRMADAVMLDGEVFQQPRTPAVNETNMKKKPTMNRATMARFIWILVICSASRLLVMPSSSGMYTAAKLNRMEEMRASPTPIQETM